MYFFVLQALRLSQRLQKLKAFSDKVTAANIKRSPRKVRRASLSHSTHGDAHRAIDSLRFARHYTTHAACSCTALHP